jgi:hypothetical protein
MTKRHTLTLLALGASLLSAGFVLGQNKGGSAAPAAQAAKPMKLIRVATLKTVEANREFTSNVQLLQAQRQAAVELKSALDKEKDAKKKKEMQTQLDQILAKLNENNDKMQKTYGFSLARNYTMEIETSHIYLQVTEEEAAAIEKAQKAPDAKKK